MSEYNQKYDSDSVSMIYAYPSDVLYFAAVNSTSHSDAWYIFIDII